MDDDPLDPPPAPLDPADWEAFRATGHRMLDDMIDFLRDVRARPAWRRPTDDAKAVLSAPAPGGPTPLAAIYEDFRRAVLPFATGNIHPAFFGWVHGSGTPTGMLAEMLAAGMNANVGGRDHAIEADRRDGATPYLSRFDRGTAAGTPWFADYGPDLSRGFRALKVWGTAGERSHGWGGRRRRVIGRTERESKRAWRRGAMGNVESAWRPPPRRPRLRARTSSPDTPPARSPPHRPSPP
jgi:hypothetical protein